jgi:hypothetical protein
MSWLVILVSAGIAAMNAKTRRAGLRAGFGRDD